MKDDDENLDYGRFTVRDILRACPFDPVRNAGGTISDDLFFSELFEKSSGFDELQESILKSFWGSAGGKSHLVLYGYSGSGKTTFARYLQRSNPELQVRILDITRTPGATSLDNSKIRSLEVMEKISALVDKKQDLAEIRELQAEINKLRLYEDPINRTFRSELLHVRWVETREAIIDVISNKAEYGTFFGPHFYSLWGAESDVSDRNAVADFLENLSFTEIFLLYMLREFRGVSNGEKYVIWFDNMDVVGADHLQEHFFKQFKSAYYDSTLLAEKFDKDFDYSKRYKFLFVLRDANREAANIHIKDAIGPNRTIRFSDSINHVELFPRIVERRFSFMKAHMSSAASEKHIEDSLETISTYLKDAIIGRMFVPLYNFDYKKLVETLYTAIVERPPGLLIDKSLGEAYGVRGRMMFAIGKNLNEIDFIKNIGFDRKAKSSDEEDGFALPTRLVLIAVINCCCSTDSRDSTPHKAERHCTLYQIIDMFSGIYTPEIVVKALVDSFLCHREDQWVPLVSFRSRIVHDIDDFSEELDPLSDSFVTDEQPVKSLTKNEAIRNLKNIQVKYNPAAYSFIRYVVVHFEFISAKFGEETPLFGTGLEPAQDSSKNGSKYRFEEKIDKVLKIVDGQRRMTGAFCRKTLFPVLDLNSNTFRSTDYCFRHKGSGGRAKNGDHQIVRVVSQHIDYVDSFRISLLREAPANAELVDINKRLCARLQSYVDLLKTDNEHHGSSSLGAELEKSLVVITNSGYRNFKTKVKITQR